MVQNRTKTNHRDHIINFFYKHRDIFKFIQKQIFNCVYNRILVYQSKKDNHSSLSSHYFEPDNAVSGSFFGLLALVSTFVSKYLF